MEVTKQDILEAGHGCIKDLRKRGKHLEAQTLEHFIQSVEEVIKMDIPQGEN